MWWLRKPKTHGKEIQVLWAVPAEPILQKPSQGSRHVASVGNNHSLHGLEQHTVIISQCWRSDIQNGLHGAKIKMSVERIFPCLLQLLEARYPWLVATFSIAKANSSVI
jgi:hypothetical protein